MYGNASKIRRARILLGRLERMNAIGRAADVPTERAGLFGRNAAEPNLLRAAGRGAGVSEGLLSAAMSPEGMVAMGLVQRFQGSNHMKPLCRACRTMSGPLVALGVVHLGHDATLAVSWNR